MKKSSAPLLLLLALALSNLEGCVTMWRMATFHSTDVSDKANLWGDFPIGAIFETQSELFLQNDQNLGKENILVAPRRLGIVGGMQYTGPYSAEVYREDPAPWPQVVGVVESGARLRVASMRFVKSPIDAGWTYPIVEILDGPHQGVRANIEDLVKKCEEYDPQKVITTCLDDRLLVRVQAVAP